MDNENIANDEPTPTEPEQGSSGLLWKVIIAIAALAVIGIFAYQFFQDGSNQNVASAPSTSDSQPAELDASSPQTLFEQGNDLVQSGQLQRAVEAYQKAIELDPNYQAAYANLGVVYYQLEQLDLAAQQYEKALEIDPSDGDVAYNLGALKLQQALLSGSEPNPDLINEAIDQLQNALELSPDLAEPYFSLGVAHAILEQPTEAIQAFETFLEKDTGQDPRASQEAQRYLETLKSE